MDHRTILNKKAVHRDNIVKYVLPDQIDEYLQQGWELGGKPLSKETCAKISERLTGRKLSCQHIANRTKAQIGLKRTEEFKSMQRLHALGHAVSDETKKKISIKNTGRSHPCSEEAKRKISIHNSSKEFQEYQCRIKIAHGTINSSKPEAECFALLKSRFGEKNVIRWYTDNRYPFECDAYIKKLDLFIEFNFHWTHGPHRFSNSAEDLALLAKWRSRQGTYLNKHNKEKDNFYIIAERIWTQKDPDKFKIAEKNQLNYLTFYSKKEFIAWIETYK